MRKITMLYFLLFFLQNAYAQITLSKPAIQDFSTSCEFQVKHNQNQNFMLVSLMQRIGSKAGSMNKAYLHMINTETDKEAREIVFEAFNFYSNKDVDKLQMYLSHWGLGAKNAKEVAVYINGRYNKPQPALFEGTKKFTGSSWYYIVTITQNKIVLKLYPSADNYAHKDKKNPKEIIIGIIKGGEIITKTRAYKYENGNLYEMNYEGGWDEYGMVDEISLSVDRPKIEDFYKPDKKFNKVTYSTPSKNGKETGLTSVTYYTETANGYDVTEASFFNGETGLILKSSITFENNEVKLTKTVSTNFMETNRLRTYSPSLTLLKVPPRGGIVSWTYNTNKEDKYKNICTASWTTAWVSENGVEKQLDVIKVEKKIPDLKNAMQVEFYRKGYGLTKTQVGNVDGKNMITLFEAQEYSTEKVNY